MGTCKLYCPIIISLCPAFGIRNPERLRSILGNGRLNEVCSNAMASERQLWLWTLLIGLGSSAFEEVENSKGAYPLVKIEVLLDVVRPD